MPLLRSGEACVCGGAHLGGRSGAGCARARRRSSQTRPGAAYRHSPGASGARARVVVERDDAGVLDLDAFLADVAKAGAEHEPLGAVKEVLAAAVADGSGVVDALPPARAGITRLHVSPGLTVLSVVWAPGMTLYPHDHRMWAAIGIYSGGEDNAFFRRDGARLAASGGKQLRPGDVCLLGDDTIHSVHNPTAQFAGAIHVYGGDFFTTPRSEWDPESLRERPYDVAHALAQFEEANRRFDATRDP